MPAYIVPAYSEELQTVMEDADAVDTQQDQPDQAAETETIARQAETPHHVPPPEAWETESTLERPEVESVPAIVNSPRDVPPTTS